ncbi:MAG: hypothetical protein GC190_19690 [Alphaproteobacteria bacterium]|nr:hypothetical protein [Alphaproteobacteria bacterium]
MSARVKTARVVLRLDPMGASAPALRSIARLAQIMQAELAARFVEDRRLMDAFALAAATPAGADDPKAALRYIERDLRRQIAAIAGEAKAAWTFDITQCSGIFAAECVLHPDDLLAIALPDVEQMMSILREEIVEGLARTSGVLLMPRAQFLPNRPIVGMVMRDVAIAPVVDASIEIAAAMRQPLAFVVADAGDLVSDVRKAVAAQWTGPGAVSLHAMPTNDVEYLAAQVRSLRPSLVVSAPPKAAIKEILARPRLLREVGAPILLLPTEASA